MFLIGSVGTIVDIPLLSATDTDEADDIIATWIDGAVTQCDARSWCCLSENGSVVSDGDVGIERNHSGNVEDDNLLAAAFYCFTERTVTTVIEISHMDDFASASACDVASVAFSSRKCRNFLALSHSRNDGKKEHGKKRGQSCQIFH